MTDGLQPSQPDRGTPGPPRLGGLLGDPRNGPRLVTSFAAIVIFGLWLSIFLTARDHRIAIFASAEQELRGATYALSSHARRTIEAVNTTLRAADTWLLNASQTTRSASLNELAQLIDDVQQANEEPVDIRPIDNHGYLFRFKQTESFRTFVGDRAYITHLEHAPPGTLYLSEPLTSRDSGRHVIPIAIRTHSNRFGIGFLVAAVTTAQFDAAYRNLLISAPGRIGILRDDGTSLVAVPEDPTLSTPAGREFLQRIIALPKDEPTLTRLPSTISGHTALTAVIKLERQPALVYATFDVEDLSERWLHDARPQIAVGIVSTLFVISIAIWLLHLMKLNAQERDKAIAALEVANAANAAKRQFLANMSHELRTPLNAILGFSEVISGALLGPLSRHYQSYGSDISKSGYHLLHLVDQLLDISRIESGVIKLDVRPNDLVGIIEEAMRIAVDSAASRTLERSVSCSPDAATVYADRGALRQILINLLTNAVKFNRPGGSVSVSARLVTGGIEIAIVDTGIGIESNNLRKLFDPFKKDDALIAQRPGQGLGLGLPIVNALVLAASGTINVQSELGVGTIVTLFFPQPALTTAEMA